MASKNTQSKLHTLPYVNKFGEDYHSQPVSKARQRKIDHVRRMLKRGDSKTRVRHYALHNMNMHGSDVVEAFKDVS